LYERTFVTDGTPCLSTHQRKLIMGRNFFICWIHINL